MPQTPLAEYVRALDNAGLLTRIKGEIYDILFKASAETMITIAADPKHLGARIGVLSVFHTWGSALIHHPHVT